MRLLSSVLLGMFFTSSAQAADKIPLLALQPLNGTQSAISGLPEYVVIIPSDQATFSSETAASVSSLTVKEGSRFKEGDVLIELDCSVQNADLKKTKALQEEATFAYNSAKKLKSYGSISEFEYIQAETQKTSADAEVDKLNSIVKKCIIKAPYNGAVSKLMINLYETVKPGDPLIKIVSTDNLDFVVQVPSSWLEWLHIDSTFTVHVSEIDKFVTVKISKITPEINSVSQTVKIIAKEANNIHDPSLMPGMSGQATFPQKPTIPTKPK